MKRNLIIIYAVALSVLLGGALFVTKYFVPQSLFASNVEALVSSENSYGGTDCWNSVGYKKGTDTRVCHSCAIERNMQPSFPEYV